MFLLPVEVSVFRYGCVDASVSTPDSTSAAQFRASLFAVLAHFLRGFRYKRQFYGDMDSSGINE
jgi:hypothetical protein